MNRNEEDVYSTSFSLKTWVGMIPFFKPYRKKILLIMLLMSLCALVDVLIPIFQKYIIDNYIIPLNTDGIWPVAALGGIGVIAATVATTVFIRVAIKVEVSFGYDLKKALFNHLQTLSLSYYNTTPVGYIIARVMSDSDRIGTLVAWGLVDVLWGSSYIIMAIISMLLLDFKLGLILVITMPFMALATSWFQSRILNYNRVVRRTNSRITGAFNEGINGARTSKSLVIEDINSREFGALTGEMYTASTRAAGLSAVFQPVIMMFGSIAIAIILVQGSGQVLTFAMPIGTLSALISYALGIFEPIRQVTRIFNDAIATQANIERVQSLLDTKPLINDSTEVIAKYGDSFEPKREGWEDIHGDIRFENVSFQYPDGNEEVLDNFSLDVPAGSCVAIVGETGAGKSTLVNLVCRFFEPTDGKILIDGRDYRERSQLWLHSSIGYVLQSPHLFSGTVRDNIRYGRLDATDDEIISAAKLVSADRVIENLPDGLDSDVGEGGDKLSTGEKQLISFARAVIANPRIFVLDEATSSVDTDTERLIQNAISNILKNRTSFIIAHRLSTIKMADLILVVRDGKIIEQGTHSELIAKKGYYLQLYTMQFERESGIGNTPQ